METIQIVVDAPLLRATDRAAKRLKINRSALVRTALQLHLKRLDAGEKEARDRAGYQRRPQDGDDLAVWEGVAAWPEE
jgi:metal-responsive CopG/Arc/MetJ family transcriptional regulator